MQEKDLKNYSIRTDLVVDMMDSNFTSQKIISKKETFQDIQILEVTITSDENELKKHSARDFQRLPSMSTSGFHPATPGSL